MKEFHKIVFDVCNKHNIKCSLLSDDWILMLEKDDKTRFFVGFKSDLNKSAVSNLLTMQSFCDKLKVIVSTEYKKDEKVFRLLTR